MYLRRLLVADSRGTIRAIPHTVAARPALLGVQLAVRATVPWLAPTDVRLLTISNETRVTVLTDATIVARAIFAWRHLLARCLGPRWLGEN